MGISFKNYHKHYWQNPLLLRAALFCFEQAAKRTQGNGLPTVLNKCAETLNQLGNFDDADVYFMRAVSEAGKRNDLPQRAYVQAGYARFKLERGAVREAKKLIEESVGVLTKAIDKTIDSLYLHVWLTQALIISGEYFLAIGDKKTAKKYADKALRHSQKYGLGFRVHDSEMLLQKINETLATIVPLVIASRLLYV